MLRPKPIQHPHPPIIVGGGGTPRGLRIAAQLRRRVQHHRTDRTVIAERYAALDAACEAIGRDPGSIVRSAMIAVLVGAMRPSLPSAGQPLLASFGTAAEGEAWLARREPKWIIGTPDAARAQIAELAALGVERLVLQNFLPRDLAMIDLLGREVISAA